MVGFGMWNGRREEENVKEEDGRRRDGCVWKEEDMDELFLWAIQSRW